MRTALRQIALSGLALFPTACAGSAGEDAEALGVLSQAITGGVLVISDENAATPFAPTVRFENCTAVKISARRFLTAIHCVSERETVVTFTNGLDGAQGANNFDVTKIFFHPSFRLAGTPDELVDKGVYELAVVEIAQDTPSIPIALLGTDGFVGPDTTSDPMLVAYGCDNSSTNDGKKQKAVFDTLAQTPNLATRVHYILEADSEITCSGDSGGPLFQLTNNQWRVIGVVAGGGHFARVSHTNFWIGAPEVPTFSFEAAGFFMNSKVSSEFGFNSMNCLAMDPPPAPTNPPSNPKIAVRLNHCDGFTGSVSGKKTGWGVLSSTIAGHFRIINIDTGRCLEAEVGGTDAIGRGCVSSSPNHAWKLIDLGQAGPAATTGVPALRYHQIKNAGGQCLGTVAGSSNINADVRMFPCNSNNQDQKWVFTH